MDASEHSGADKRELSRWQLNAFVECPRCFWFVKHGRIPLPKTFPYALNNTMDGLLKAEFDVFRAKGALHPSLVEAGLNVRLFEDVAKLRVWRNNFQGLRWTDPESGYTLFGAIDDLLTFPDGSLAVLDYKASGSREATIYPSYQLQAEVYMFLLQQMGYRIAPRAYVAFFLAVRDDEFRGRLPFRSVILEVTPNVNRVLPLLRDAVRVAQASELPASGQTCDLCRWAGQALPMLAAPADLAHATGPTARTVHEQLELFRPA